MNKRLMTLRTFDLSIFPFSFTITMKGTIKKEIRRIKLKKGMSTIFVGLQERRSTQRSSLSTCAIYYSKRHATKSRNEVLRTGKEAPNEVLCRLARYIILKDTLPSLATKLSEQEKKHPTKFSVSRCYHKSRLGDVKEGEDKEVEEETTKKTLLRS